MKMRKKVSMTLVFIMFILLSLACASNSGIDYTKYHTTEAFSIPDLNQISIVSVGDTLLKQGTLVTTQAIKIKNDTLDGHVKKGLYKYDGKDKNGNKIFIPDYGSGASFVTTPNTQIQFLVYGPLKKMVDDKMVVVGNDLRTGIINGFNTITKSKKISESDYEFTTIIAPEENSFQQVLLYTGRENNIIKFSYREYNNDFARPDFTVNVQYDMNQSKIISFRQARIEIIEATNSSITYKVLSNFN